ncbi:hypothetical protein K1X76_02560 [bacterium]|nr:hypothetical protein [bacterium]
MLLVLGLILRKNRPLHARLMIAAIVSDLITVLILEIQRDAIKTALSFTLSVLQQTHILFSSLATLLYFPALILGLILYFSNKPALIQKWRPIHIKIGYTAFIFRSLGFGMMFTLLWK